LGIKIVTSKNGKSLILTLEGRVDAFAAKNLQNTIEQQITPDIAAVVFDLKDVSYACLAGRFSETNTL